MDLHKIKNIVFDLGGVVIDLRRENAVEALTALGIRGVDELLGLYRQTGPFLELEIGELTAAEFFDAMRARAREGVTDLQLQEAFNSFLTGLPEERLDRLRELRRKGYRVFALSNTNAVMFGSWIASAFRKQGLRADDYFDGIVASFREGVCKPDHEIFLRLLRRYGLDPAETLMLDDSEANCEAARHAGMHAEKVEAPGTGRDMLALTQPFI